MADHLFPDDILFMQRLLSCCGLYTDDLDGLWGPDTDAAEKAYFIESDALSHKHGAFDARSERCLRTMRLDTQKAARMSLARIRAAGVDARIISGTRSYAEQAALFRKGRFGDPGPKVTKAKAGQSWHNFGLAWDLGIFDQGYVKDEAPYRAIAGTAKDATIEWGGDWTSFVDVPHYQLKQAMTIAQARAHFEAGCRT
jgi:peptidoglycan L-alanyl-D-glutamate endopeptidase CwlK